MVTLSLVKRLFVIYCITRLAKRKANTIKKVAKFADNDADFKSADKAAHK